MAFGKLEEAVKNEPEWPLKSRETALRTGLTASKEQGH